jgi:ribonuclease G
MASVEEREQVLKIVRNEVKKDRSVVRIIGFTELHLLQLTRKKIREPLTGMLLQKCEPCHGKGTVYSSETIAFQLERKLLEYYRSDEEAIIVQLTEDVKSILDRLPDLVERTGVEIQYVKLAGMPGYEIVFTGSILDAKDRLKSLEPY